VYPESLEEFEFPKGSSWAAAERSIP
jgi:hypothetical protein